MNWYENHILKKSGKDAVSVTKWNKSAISNLEQAGLVASLGVANNGKSKGSKGVLITDSGKKYLNNLKKEQKETKRYWGTIIRHGVKFCVSDFRQNQGWRRGTEQRGG